MEGWPWGGPRPGCRGTGAGRQDEEACSPRRGINGAARFKFQISPRQMSLGKEQSVLAAAGGGGRGGPWRPLALPSCNSLTLLE